MVNAYNLTVQLQLQSPKNVNQVLNDLRRQLKPIDADVRVKANASSVATLNKELSKTKKNVDASKQSMDSLNRAIQESARRFSVITIATGTFLGFASSVKNAVKESIAFEKELIRIKQVTGDTNKGIQGLAEEVTRLSTSFGVSSSELLKTATTLAQAGFTAEQTKKSLDILAKTTLGATFGSIQETTEGVIAILNQFGKEAIASGNEIKFLEKSLDSINAISKAFAVESSDIIAAIRRTGGVFAATGGKVEQLAAIFTSVRATTRESAETIATGLRTIFTRIQRTDTINQLQDLGIALRYADGQFVGAFEAVKRLSEGLASLDPRDYRYSDIIEELGGFRQVGKVIPLIQQFRIAQEALSVAQKSSGSITRDAELAQEGLGVKIDKVREKFDALIRKVSETSTFQNIAKSALSLAEAFIKVADSLAPLIPLITTLITLRLGKSIAPAIAGLAGIGKTPRGTGPVSRFARGGVVPGTGNSDTVPAMLTPGEFVIKKSSVKKLGVDTLRRMNENRYAKAGKAKDNSTNLSDSGVYNKLAGKDAKYTVVGAKKSAKNKTELIPPNKKNGKEINLKDTEFAHLDDFDLKNRGIKLKISGKRVNKLYSKVGLDLPAVWNNDWRKKNNYGVTANTLGKYVNARNVFATTLNMMKKDKISTGESKPTPEAKINAPIDKPKRNDYSLLGNIDDPKIEKEAVEAFKKNRKKIRTDLAQKIKSKGDLFFDTDDDIIKAGIAEDLFSSIKENLNIKDKKKQNLNYGDQVVFGLKRFAKFGYTDSKGESQRQEIPRTTETKEGIYRDIESKLNSGGSPKGSGSTDTIPALLTPGEFVFNKQAAQRIGYGNLDRMNKKGVAKFAKGGPVGFVRLSNGGDPEDEVDEIKEQIRKIREQNVEIYASQYAKKKTINPDDPEFPGIKKLENQNLSTPPKTPPKSKKRSEPYSQEEYRALKPRQKLDAVAKGLAPPLGQAADSPKPSQSAPPLFPDPPKAPQAPAKAVSAPQPTTKPKGVIGTGLSSVVSKAVSSPTPSTEKESAQPAVPQAPAKAVSAPQPTTKPKGVIGTGLSSVVSKAVAEKEPAQPAAKQVQAVEVPTSSDKQQQRDSENARRSALSPLDDLIRQGRQQRDLENARKSAQVKAAVRARRPKDPLAARRKAKSSNRPRSLVKDPIAESVSGAAVQKEAASTTVSAAATEQEKQQEPIQQPSQYSKVSSLEDQKARTAVLQAKRSEIEQKINSADQQRNQVYSETTQAVNESNKSRESKTQARAEADKKYQEETDKLLNQLDLYEKAISRSIDSENALNAAREKQKKAAQQQADIERLYKEPEPSRQTTVFEASKKPLPAPTDIVQPRGPVDQVTSREFKARANTPERSGITSRISEISGGIREDESEIQQLTKQRDEQKAVAEAKESRRAQIESSFDSMSTSAQTRATPSLNKATEEANTSTEALLKTEELLQKKQQELAAKIQERINLANKSRDIKSDVAQTIVSGTPSTFNRSAAKASVSSGATPGLEVGGGNAAGPISNVSEYLYSFGASVENTEKALRLFEEKIKSGATQQQALEIAIQKLAQRAESIAAKASDVEAGDIGKETESTKAISATTKASKSAVSDAKDDCQCQKLIVDAIQKLGTINVEKTTDDDKQSESPEESPRAPENQEKNIETEKANSALSGFANGIANTLDKLDGFVLLGASAAALTSQMSGLSESTKSAINQAAAFASTFVGVGQAVFASISQAQESFKNMKETVSSFIPVQKTETVTTAQSSIANQKEATDSIKAAVADSAEAKSSLEVAVSNRAQVATSKVGLLSKAKASIGGKIEQATKTNRAGVARDIGGGFVVGLTAAVSALQYFSAEATALADEAAATVKKGFEDAANGVSVNTEALKQAAKEEIELRNKAGNIFNATTIATAGSFALAGAALGSVFIPGIGTAAGALIGGLAGAAFGVAASFGLIEMEWIPGMKEEIAAREASISTIYDSIDSIVALNQAQYDLSENLSRIDQSSSLSPQERISQRLEATSEASQTGKIEGAEATKELQDYASRFGSTVSELSGATEEQIRKIVESTGNVSNIDLEVQKIQFAAQQLGSSMSLMSLATKETATTLNLAKSSFDLNKPETIEAYNKALEQATTALTNENNQRIKASQATVQEKQLALAGKSGDELEQAQRELTAAQQEHDRVVRSANNAIQAMANDSRAFVDIKQAEYATIQRTISAQIAQYQALQRANDFMDQLSARSADLDKQSKAIDNFASALNNQVSSFEASSIRGLEDPTNVRDTQRFAQEIAFTTQNAGPEAQRQGRELARLSQISQDAQTLINIDVSRSEKTPNEILAGAGITEDSVGTDIFNEMSKKLADVSGRITPEILSGILSPLAEQTGAYAKNIQGIIDNQNKELQVYAKYLDAFDNIRRQELEGREKLNETLTRGTELRATARRQEVTIDRKQANRIFVAQSQLNAGARFRSGGVQLRAGDITGLKRERDRAKLELQRIQTEKNLAQTSKDRVKILQRLQKEEREYINTVNDATAELDRLANQSDRTSDILGEIGKEQAKRETLTKIIEEFVVGGTEERRAQVEAFAGIQNVLMTGTLQGQTAEQRSATVGLLDRLQDIIIPGTGGLTGKDVKQEVVFRDAIRMGLDPNIARQLATATSKEEKLIQALDRLTEQMESAARARADAPQINPVFPAKGGLISPVYKKGGGSIFSPKGTDTVPAMLTPGEFVVKKSAVDKVGAGALQAINNGVSPVYKDVGGSVPGFIDWIGTLLMDKMRKDRKVDYTRVNAEIKEREEKEEREQREQRETISIGASLMRKNRKDRNVDYTRLNEEKGKSEEFAKERQEKENAINYQKPIDSKPTPKPDSRTAFMETPQREYKRLYGELFKANSLGEYYEDRFTAFAGQSRKDYLQERLSYLEKTYGLDELNKDDSVELNDKERRKESYRRASLALAQEKRLNRDREEKSDRQSRLDSDQQKFEQKRFNKTILMTLGRYSVSDEAGFNAADAIFKNENPVQQALWEAKKLELEEEKRKKEEKKLFAPGGIFENEQSKNARITKENKGLEQKLSNEGVFTSPPKSFAEIPKEYRDAYDVRYISGKTNLTEEQAYQYYMDNIYAKTPTKFAEIPFDQQEKYYRNRDLMQTKATEEEAYSYYMKNRYKGSAPRSFEDIPVDFQERWRKNVDSGKTTMTKAEAYRYWMENYYGKAQYRANGGTIFKPKGTDTVPAMLTPGEFVIRKSAVDKVGVGTLQAINNGQGLSNGGVVYRQAGGMIPGGINLGNVGLGQQVNLIKSNQLKTALTEAIIAAGPAGFFRIADKNSLTPKDSKQRRAIASLIQSGKIRELEPIFGNELFRLVDSLESNLSSFTQLNASGVQIKGPIDQLAGKTPEQAASILKSYFSKQQLILSNTRPIITDKGANTALTLLEKYLGVNINSQIGRLFQAINSEQNAYADYFGIKPQDLTSISAQNIQNVNALIENIQNRQALGAGKAGGVGFMDDAKSANFKQLARDSTLFFKSGGRVPYFSSGGGVDSIPAMLTPGEFVMNADTVRKYGVEKMKQLNKGNIPGFNRGGSVGGEEGGSINPSAGGTLSLDTSRIQGVFDNFIGNFSPILDNITKVFSGVSDSLNKLAESFGGFTMQHTVTVDGLINLGGLNIDTIKNELSKSIGQMVADEVTKRMDDQSNKFSAG